MQRFLCWFWTLYGNNLSDDIPYAYDSSLTAGGIDEIKPKGNWNSLLAFYLDLFYRLFILLNTQASKQAIKFIVLHKHHGIEHVNIWWLASAAWIFKEWKRSFQCFFFCRKKFLLLKCSKRRKKEAFFGQTVTVIQIQCHIFMCSIKYPDFIFWRARRILFCRTISILNILKFRHACYIHVKCVSANFERSLFN